jgi:transposase-like protein|tara:strand:- start:334 stop:639 length:306 start_codon:yes stop_codon:yes gene_type:complete
MNCSICRVKHIIKDYKLYNTNTKETTYWCKECLTSFSEEVNYGDYKTTKLRDTNIDKYNEAINDYKFIPIAFRMKINQQTGEVIIPNETGRNKELSLQESK